MQRLNRSAHAPVGTAFFLFLGLAIIPVSLRAVGVQVSFSPRLSAAMDAWQQIAEVFGASYQPAPASELSVVKDLDGDPSNPIESSVRAAGSEFACAHRDEEYDEEGAGTVLDVPKAGVPRATRALRASNRSESRRSAAANRVALFVAAEAIKASFEKNARSIAALGAMKLQTLTREHLVKNNDRQAFWKSFEPMSEIKNLPAPKNVRMLVRMKRAAAGFSAKAAECKVSAALASAQRHECDRAILNSVPAATLDNSEF